MKRVRCSKNSYLIAFYFALLAAVIASSIMIQRLIPRESFTSSNLMAAITFHYHWIIEFGVMALISLWLSSYKSWARKCHYFIAFIFLLIVAIQILALDLSQTFVSGLSLENIGHISLLINLKTMCAGLAFFAFFLCYVKIAERLTRKFPSSFATNVKASIAIIFLVTTATTSKFLSEEIRNKRTMLFENRMIGSAPPVYALFKVVTRFGLAKKESGVELSNSEYELAESLGFHFFNSANSAFPLVKNFVYRNPIPFIKQGEKIAAPNIIIFFIEGTSARLLGFNNKARPDLTPFLNDFAADPNVMVVDNYYNHTAATYRGLQGQLCSTYPTHGGYVGFGEFPKFLPEMTNLCLPHLLSKMGYDTTFLDCHKKGEAYIKDLVMKTGFNVVLNAEEMQKEYLQNEEFRRHDGISDQQLLRSLVGYLQKREQTHTDKPLLLGLYNVGTHANQEMPLDGKLYDNGSNTVINNLHNYDNAFGRFWTWFKQSSYTKNTIVVVTADHAHYPEPDMISAVAEDYQPYFVDRIPLMYYNPMLQIPKKFDANYSTSIDFTPSLLHQLGVGNFSNHFLGTSIFEEDRKKWEGFGVANYDFEYFFIDKAGIHREQGPYQNIAESIKRIVSVTKDLEVKNRLWRREWDDLLFSEREALNRISINSDSN